MVFLFFFAVSVSANVYISPVYESNQSAVAKFPTLSINGINSNELTLNITGYGSVTGSGTTTTAYKLPINTTTATATSTSSGACVNLGILSYSNIQSMSIVENELTATTSASSMFLKPKTNIIINSASNYVTFSQNSAKDATGHIKNLLYHGIYVGSGAGSKLDATKSNDTYAIMINATNCYIYSLEPAAPQTYSWDCDGSSGDNSYHAQAYLRYFLLNSSASGLVSYNISIGAITYDADSSNHGAIYEIGYIVLGSSSKTILSLTQTSAGNLTLTPNTIYVFYTMAQGEAKGAGSGSHPFCAVNEGDYNTTFTINMGTPNWNCGAWSECAAGIQSRSCTDANNILAPKVENQACYSAPSGSVTLGFEDTYSAKVWYSYIYYWLTWPTCISSIYAGTKSVEFPASWAVNTYQNPNITDNVTSKSAYLLDVMEVSSIEHYTGTKSLKLWYIPPERNLPTCSNWTGQLDWEGINAESCSIVPDGNTTQGRIGNIYKKINETYLLGYNLSFSYPNMSISFAVKKCSESPLAYAGNASLIPATSCGNGYYTNSKERQKPLPDAHIWIAVYPNSPDNQVITPTFDVIADKESWSSRELILSNLAVGENYTFYVGVYPEYSQIDTNSYCVYIDQFELRAYQGAVRCESYCSGLTRYTAKDYSNGICQYDITEPSVECCTDELCKNSINNCVSRCDCSTNSLTYLTNFVASNSTGSCAFTKESNSTYCYQYCNTQDITKGNGTALGLPAWTNPLFSPLFWLFIMVIVIMVIITWLTKSWEIALIAGFLLILVLAMLFVEMAWIAIIFIILAAFVAGKWLLGYAKGG